MFVILVPISHASCSGSLIIPVKREDNYQSNCNFTVYKGVTLTVIYFSKTITVHSFRALCKMTLVPVPAEKFACPTCWCY